MTRLFQKYLKQIDKNIKSLELSQLDSNMEGVSYMKYFVS